MEFRARVADMRTKTQRNIFVMEGKNQIYKQHWKQLCVRRYLLENVSFMIFSFLQLKGLTGLLDKFARTFSQIGPFEFMSINPLWKTWIFRSIYKFLTLDFSLDVCYFLLFSLDFQY